MFEGLKKSISGIDSTVNKPATNVEQLLTIFANIAIIIASGFSVISFALSFIKFVTSQGDPKAIQGARTSLTWAIVAMFVAVGAWTLASILAGLMGVK